MGILEVKSNLTDGERPTLTHTYALHDLKVWQYYFNFFVYYYLLYVVWGKVIFVLRRIGFKVNVLR